MYLKITGNQRIEVSNIDGQKIKELLLDIEPPKFIEVNGQSIKTANIIGVFNEDQQNVPAYMEFSWSDEESEIWEKEIFGENWKQGELIRDTFKQYLVDVGVWVINSKYPDGAVKDPKKYRELDAKWSALQDLRFRREMRGDHKKRDELIKSIKAQLKGLSNKMGVKPENPIQKPEEPISEKPKFHTEGCEIQHTGKCNCGYKPNPDDEISEERKALLRSIPF